MTTTAPTIVIQLGSDSMGRGDTDLGKRLMKTFLNVLPEADLKTTAIVFFNSGVKLACEGSDVLEPLQDLEKEGVLLLSCGTCLEHYGLKDQVAAGRASNMVEITDTMLRADRVIPF